MRWRLISSFLLRRGDWREDVSAYLDDELSPRDRERVETSLAGSAEMREYLADLEQMRTALRSFEPASSAAPFQLTPEMLDDPARIAVRPSSPARALRLSMSTAAVGVATFAAVMVFDAVDSPTVNFTTTSADGQATSVPTAAVATAEVEVQSQSTSAAAADGAEQPAGGESLVPAAEDEQAEPEVVAVAASEQQETASAEELETAEAVELSGEAAQEAQVAGEVSEQAAADPSRRALTAGRGGGSSAAQQVTAADVVAQQEAQQETGQERGQAAAEAEAAAAEQVDSADSSDAEPRQPQAAAETAAPAADDGRQPAAAASPTERRSVVTVVARGESDWPLEQRPRSATVRLASDPSWERPVQIVLAAVAITATTLWLVLTIVDRRRRA